MNVRAYPSKKHRDEYLILSASPRQKRPPETVRNRFEARPYKEFDTDTHPVGLDPQVPQTIAENGYYIATTKLGFAARASISPQSDTRAAAFAHRVPSILTRHNPAPTRLGVVRERDSEKLRPGSRSPRSRSPCPALRRGKLERLPGRC